MLSKQRILAVALHLCVATQSDAFSLRPASGAAFAAVAPRGGRLVVVAPTHRTAPALRADRRPARRTGPLFAGGSALIPSYEEIMERLPSKKVLEEVERKRGAPIVASDLATKAGISLTQARKDLTTLASLTRGDIAVSGDGELLYSFPDDVNAVLSSNSAKYRAVSVFKEKVFPPLFYVTKIGFGVVLVASLVAIFSTIFFATSGSSSDDERRDNRRGGGMGGMFGGFWGPSPFDFFYYRPYYSRYSVYPGQGGRQRDPEEMGFLESVFSYVFGDGDANPDKEERRIALAAEMIRRNGGAVAAEQLAPFCDDAPLPLTAEGRLGEERVYVDESFVLPIVTQLGGEPQVTEEGDIVYTFPELMTSASSKATAPARSSEETERTRRESRILKLAGLDADASTRSINTLLSMNRISTRGALTRSDLIDILGDALPDEDSAESTELDVSDPTLLLEREYKFSLASGGQTLLAAVLGVVNLGGALYLGNILGQYASYGVRMPSYFGLVQQFFPLLLGYAVLFNAIPLARKLWIERQNSNIAARNKVRRSWKEVVEQKSGSVERKLTSATLFGKRMKQLGAGGKDIVFDTSQEFQEVEKTKEKDDMKEFDKMLEEKETSAWE